MIGELLTDWAAIRRNVAALVAVALEQERRIAELEASEKIPTLTEVVITK